MNGFTRRVRRIVLGPTTEEINEQVLAEGGPGYSVSRTSTQPPTTLEPGEDPFLASDWRQLGASKPAGDFAPFVSASAIGRGRQRAIDHLNYQAARTPTGDPMPDRPRAMFEPGDESDGVTPRPRMAAADPYDSMAGGVSDAEEYRPDPVADSGVHAAPDQPAAGLPAVRTPCHTCEGTGYVTRTINDLLRESLALIPEDGGDMVIAEFYRRLLRAAPDLAPLFPADLVTAAHGSGTPGALQRDRLFGAVAALGELYGAGPEAMARLRTALESMGHRHAAFARPDGRIEGATPEEYLAVKDVFLGTLIDIAGEAWQLPFSDAWSRAYNHAMSVMLGAQASYLEEHPEAFARYPRADAGTGRHA